MPTKILYQLIGSAFLVLLLVGGLLWYGHSKYEDGYQAAIAKSVAKTQQVVKVQREVTTRVITKYVPQLQVVYERGATIVKKVPIYVTTKDNSRCIVNNGFVQLWNSANGVQVSDSTKGVNEKASSVELSEVAAEHARESTICTATQLQLVTLQDWIREQQSVTR